MLPGYVYQSSVFGKLRKRNDLQLGVLMAIPPTDIRILKYFLNYINSNEFTCTMLPWLFIAVISVRQTSEKQLTYN